MPVQFNSGDSNRWTIAPAVNTVQNALTIDKESDGFLSIAAKRFTAVPANTALLIAALAETMLKATMTALAVLLYPITDAPLKEFQDSTNLAGRATAEAFKGIFGYATALEKKESPVPVIAAPSRTDIAKEAINVAANFVWANKSKIAIGLALGYFIGIPAAKATWEAVKEDGSAFASDFANKTANAYDRLYNVAASTFGYFKNVEVPVSKVIPKAISPSIITKNSLTATSTVVEQIVNPTTPNTVVERFLNAATNPITPTPIVESLESKCTFTDSMNKAIDRFNHLTITAIKNSGAYIGGTIAKGTDAALTGIKDGGAYIGGTFTSGTDAVGTGIKNGGAYIVDAITSRANLRAASIAREAVTIKNAVVYGSDLITTKTALAVASIKVNGAYAATIIADKASATVTGIKEGGSYVGDVIATRTPIALTAIKDHGTYAATIIADKASATVTGIKEGGSYVGEVIATRTPIALAAIKDHGAYAATTIASRASAVWNEIVSFHSGATVNNLPIVEPFLNAVHIPTTSNTVVEQVVNAPTANIFAVSNPYEQSLIQKATKAMMDEVMRLRESCARNAKYVTDGFGDEAFPEISRKYPNTTQLEQSFLKDWGLA